MNPAVILVSVLLVIVGTVGGLYLSVLSLMGVTIGYIYMSWRVARSEGAGAASIAFISCGLTLVPMWVAGIAVRLSGQLDHVEWTRIVGAVQEVVFR